jgi:glycosyltransferase involved in cell wall biosynthesis
MEQSEKNTKFTKTKKIGHIGRLLEMMSLIKILHKAYKEERFELIHVHDSIAFIPVYLFSLVYKIPTVFTFHGCIFIAGRDIDYSRLTTMQYKSTNRFCAKKANAIVCISQQMMEGALIAGARKENLHLIPGFINTELFQRYTPKRLKASGDKMCLYVGALRPTKGIEYLVGAIPQVVEKINNVKFLLIGDGDSSYERKIFDLVKKLKASRYIEFKGRVDKQKLPAYYQKADLFILPSISEPQGLVILEAMASGLPVVASKVGGIPEMVRDGYNGLLVPAGDSNALFGAIIEILSNKEQYENCSKNALDSVHNYPKDQYIDKLIRVYSSLID